MREAPPSLETLLAHQDFVRGLARGLLGRDDRVEDVVQETWLAAVRHPPRHGASPRGWLARVVRNAALRLRQREARRPRVEAGASGIRGRAAVPTPDEVLQREAIRRRVVGALLGLPEGDREVLLLRYYEDLPPRLVAERLGLPVETVRTRIRRALARLRDALETEPGPAWRAWAVASLPGPALLGGSSLAVVVGALTMKKILATGAAAVLVLLAGWWVARETGLLSRDAPDAGSAALRVEPAGPPQASGEDGPRLQGLAEREIAHARVLYGVVRGRVVDVSGRPVVGAHLWIGSTRVPRWLASLYAGDFHATSDEEGRFLFAPRSPVDYVCATADGYAADADYWRGGDVPLELVLCRTDVVVRGTVRDLDGRPVADARVVVHAASGRQSSTWGSTGPDGRYEIPFVSGRETYVRAYAPGFLQVEVRIPWQPTDATPGIDLVLRPGYWIEGRVTDAETGRGVGGAVLKTYELFGPEPTTDADGCLRFLATCASSQITASAAGYRDGSAMLQVRGSAARVDLALQPSASCALQGVVLDADGAPVADAHVHTVADVHLRIPANVRVDTVGGPHAWTDPDGRFLLHASPPVEGRVQALLAEAGDAAPAIVLDPQPGEPIELRLGEPSVLTGRVVMPDGTPAVGASMVVRPHADADLPPALFAALACALPHAVRQDGTFRVGGLPRGDVVLEVRPAADGEARPASVRVAVPHPDPIEVVLRPGPVLSGRVVDPEGGGVPFANLSFRGSDRRQSRVTDAEGRFRVPGLGLDPIRLHVAAPGYRLWTRELTVVDEPLEVRLIPNPWIRFRLRGDVPPTGSPVYVGRREPGSRGSGGGSACLLDGEVWWEEHHDRRVPLEYVLTGDGWTTRPVVVAGPTGTDDVLVDVEMVPLAPATETAEEAAGEEATVPVATGSIAGRLQSWRADQEGSTFETRTSVRARRDEPERVRLGTLVEADGSFRIEDVPAGEWWVSLDRGFHFGEAIPVRVEAGQTTEVLDLVALELGPSLHGVVRDDGGETVSDVMIWARPENDRARIGAAHTNRDGTFELRDLEAGERYRLEMQDSRGRGEECVVLPGPDAVTLRFVRHGVLRGTLAGPWGDDTPFEGRVRIRGTGTEGFQTSARLQEDGRELYFERRLPPGEYVVTARLGDWVTSSAQPVHVPSGESAARLDLVLVKGGIVHVRVRDPEGAPQRGCRLRLPVEWDEARMVKTLEDGARTVRGVPPGEWTVVAYGGRGKGETTFSIQAGEEVELEIVVSP